MIGLYHVARSTDGSTAAADQWDTWPIPPKAVNQAKCHSDTTQDDGENDRDAGISELGVVLQGFQITVGAVHYYPDHEERLR